MQRPLETPCTKSASLVRKWVRLGVAPEPVLPGRTGASWPSVRGTALYRERSAMLRVGASQDSPLSALGVEVFHRIARLVAGANPDDHTDTLSAHQLRHLLPLALACRAHYALIRALAHALNISAPQHAGRSLSLDVLAHALLSYPHLRALQLIGPLEAPARTTLLLSRLTLSLTELRLYLCADLTPSSIRALRSCIRLRRIYLTACGNIRPEAAFEIAQLPSLRDVRIYGCGRTSDASFIRLVSAQALESVDISGGMQFSNSTLDAISRSPSSSTLRRLILSPCTHISERAVCALLARTPQLEELQLERAWRISYLVACRAAERAPRLRKLCLRRCGSYVWHDAGEMIALPDLRRLEVSGDSFNDAQLAIFTAGCKALEIVVIEQCQAVSDDGMRDVCALPALKELHLAHCKNISDGVVAHIRQARNAPLQFVRLTACNSVGENACKELEKYCISTLHPFMP